MIGTCFSWWALASSVALSLGGQDGPASDSHSMPDIPAPTLEDGLRWWDARAGCLEGLGFDGRASPYDRLPARAQETVRQPVWDLAQHSAGVAVRFVTNSTTVRARWTLRSDRLSMTHMPATGVSGVDLYVKRGKSWRWVQCGQPTALKNESRLVQGLETAPREFMLYLPLYNGVTNVTVGIDADATFEAAPSRGAPIVFYGTSITQGACASRPGLAHVARLGRRLDRPVVNLGFSGNGRLEPPFPMLLAELDAAIYVLDCLPNLQAEQVATRTVPFVTKLRDAKPHTPILLVEDRTYADAPFNPSRRKRNAESREAFRTAYQTLVDSGMPGLAYLAGDRLLGADGDDTVDGSHPNDVGFLRHADAFEPTLRRLLGPR